ncbi:MAG TPA: adenylate/guanylate cyclase domain-containing protein [Chlamydiales bacterium]|nr:adenylate/guanylate cyclase domain-containing protein [Chlamydiales bacterium]
MRKVSLQLLLVVLFSGISILSSWIALTMTGTLAYELFHTLYNAIGNKTTQYVSARINALLYQVEQLTRIGKDIAEDNLEMSLNNKALTDYFLKQLKDTLYLTSYFAGTPQGGYFLAYDLSLIPNQLEQFHLPPGTGYVILVSDGSNTQTQAYYDNDLKLISTSQSPNDFDPRTRPWYQLANKTKDLVWTPLYLYYPTEKEGITSTQAAYSDTGQLTIVVGADLAIEVFSQFLNQGKFSPNGHALILDQSGNTLFSETPDAHINKALGEAVFATAREKNDSTEFTLSFKNNVYHVNIAKFPPTFTNKWELAVLLPRSDIFANIIHQVYVGIIAAAIISLLGAFVTVAVSYSISQPIVHLSHEIDQIAKLELEGDQKITSHISEINQIEQAIYSMRIALRAFSRYIPEDIAKQLMQREHNIVLGGQEKVVTIFFTDIANFTSISERLPIETVNLLLASHFDLLSQTILDSGGTIDKYLGDGIMSLWGALESNSKNQHAIWACKAALLGQIRLKELNQKQKEAGMPEFLTRMGINTGLVIVGNFGTEKRMNFSVLGDPVNIASRLEGLSKIYGTKIIISEETYKAVDPHFLVRFLDTVEVRGKQTKIKVYELLGAYGLEPLPTPDAKTIELAHTFTDAATAFDEGDQEKAKRLFTQLHKDFPEDQPTILHLNKLGIS